MESYDKLVEEHRETLRMYEPRLAYGNLTDHELHSYWEARHFLDFHVLETSKKVSDVSKNRIVKQYEYSRKKLDELEQKVLEDLKKRMGKK